MLPDLSAIVSRLHLRHFRLLTALGDQKSLMRAAAQIGMSQPGASKALQEIEVALGGILFTRTNRGLVPTDLGRCAIRYARLIETDIGHLREEMAAVLRGHGGRLAIGSIMGAVPLLSEKLVRLLALHPQISVEIVEDTSAVLLRRLDQGRLDAAICRTTISQRPDLYKSAIVREETLAVVARTGHPLASAKSLQLADLVDARWIVYSANMPMRLLLEREFHHAGLRFPLYLVETTSAFTTLSLLQQEPSFVALLSSDVARFCQSFGMTSIIPLRLRSRSEPYELVTRRDPPASPALRLFLQQFHPLPEGAG